MSGSARRRHRATRPAPGATTRTAPRCRRSNPAPRATRKNPRRRTGACPAVARRATARTETLTSRSSRSHRLLASRATRRRNFPGFTQSTSMPRARTVTSRTARRATIERRVPDRATRTSATTRKERPSARVVIRLRASHDSYGRYPNAPVRGCRESSCDSEERHSGSSSTPSMCSALPASVMPSTPCASRDTSAP